MSEPLTLNGACHCGQVRFRVRLAEGLDTARRCNCSFCRMRGAVALTARVGDIEFTQGEERLTRYRSTPASPSTISAPSAASIPTTAGARTRTSTASTPPVWRVSVPSISPRCQSTTGSPTPMIARNGQVTTSPACSDTSRGRQVFRPSGFRLAIAADSGVVPRCLVLQTHGSTSTMRSRRPW